MPAGDAGASLSLRDAVMPPDLAPGDLVVCCKAPGRYRRWVGQPFVFISALSSMTVDEAVGALSILDTFISAKVARDMHAEGHRVGIIVGPDGIDWSWFDLHWQFKLLGRQSALQEALGCIDFMNEVFNPGDRVVVPRATLEPLADGLPGLLGCHDATHRR